MGSEDLKNSKKDINELRKLVKIMSNVTSAENLLHWDSETGGLPQEALESRAEQESALAEINHKHLTSKKMKNLLERLSNPSVNEYLSSEEKALVREWKESYDDATKLPLKLVKEKSKLLGKSSHIWAKARKENNYSSFAPVLEKIIIISKKEAELIGKRDNLYDTLLDKYEKNMTSDQLDVLFADLKKAIVPLISNIQKKVKVEQQHNSDAYNFSFLSMPVDSEKMEKFCTDVVEDMGFDLLRGKIAKSAHPFTIGISSPNDVRITVGNYNNPTFYDFLDELSSMMHEGGHALVEQGIDKKLEGTGLADFSMGIHESQSRLWENIVGKSKPFWTHYYPKLKSTFPEQLKDVSLEDFYTAINQVHSSPIRIKADEVTYNLHIILRYELEKDFINGDNLKEKIKNLPELWNDKMNNYLGITPENDARGVLQDIHWSCSNFGYFPTYSLGNLASAQIYEAAKKEIPDLEKKIANGDLKTLKNWLNEKIHRRGSIDLPDELMRKVTGEPLNSKYFADYLKNKYSDIYNLK